MTEYRGQYHFNLQQTFSKFPYSYELNNTPRFTLTLFFLIDTIIKFLYSHHFSRYRTSIHMLFYFQSLVEMYSLRKYIP